MRRTICCALLALLAATGTAFPQRFRYRYFARPYISPVGRQAYYPYWSSRWLPRPYVPIADRFALPYGVNSPPIDYTLPVPSYVFLGNASASYPRLVFNDGTSYNVADYWREDDQLHFITVEDGGAKFVPHTVPFSDLDVDKTKDRAKAEGFRFLIRDKPLDQWLEDRASKDKRDSKK